MIEGKMMNSKCLKNEKQIARLAGGDLQSSRAVRLQQHLAGCTACRGLHDSLMQSSKIFAAALEQGADGGFSSILGDVRTRLAAANQLPERRASLWSVLAPVAAMAATAGFLLLAGGQNGVPVGDPAGDKQAILELSSGADAGNYLLRIEPNTQDFHQVAVSRRSDDFGQAQVFTLRRGQVEDPMPSPAPGEVFFYRID